MLAVCRGRKHSCGISDAGKRTEGRLRGLRDPVLGKECTPQMVSVITEVITVGRGGGGAQYLQGPTNRGFFSLLSVSTSEGAGASGISGSTVGLGRRWHHLAISTVQCLPGTPR